ncbi:MAG: hypothetical protein AN484_26470, partial [Aphanizomenon flos-aquae WA102]
LIFDSGASDSLVTRAFARRANLKRIGDCRRTVQNFGGQSLQCSGLYSLEIRGEGGKMTSMAVKAVPDLGSLPEVKCPRWIEEVLPGTRGLWSDLDQPGGRVDLVLGVDEIVAHPELLKKVGGLCLFQSAFGGRHILAGTLPPRPEAELEPLTKTSLQCKYAAEPEIRGRPEAQVVSVQEVTPEVEPEEAAEAKKAPPRSGKEKQSGETVDERLIRKALVKTLEAEIARLEEKKRRKASALRAAETAPSQRRAETEGEAGELEPPGKRLRGGKGRLSLSPWIMAATMLSVMCGPAEAFTAYDCTNVTNSVVAYSLLDPAPCDSGSKNADFERTVHGELVQQRKDRVTDVFRCQVVESIMSQYCGMWSAAGVVRYLKFREPKNVDPAACR